MVKMPEMPTSDTGSPSGSSQPSSDSFSDYNTILSTASDEDVPSPLFPEDLKRALRNTSQLFMPYTGGACYLPSPGLHIAHMDDPVAFPLTPYQAEQLAKLAKPCPHGRGCETVVDANVRDCLQIEPSSLSFSNPEWNVAIAQLKITVAEALGVPADAIGASLYKLLLYPPGGHFKPHRDTEKERGMFATLSIQLPSVFEGGQLVVTHKGQSVTYHAGSLDGSCKYKSHYTAFFADVEHQIHPVTQGYRITLVYNLAWLNNGCPPNVESNDVSEVRSALSEHAKQFPPGAWQVTFGLEHKYTDASLSMLGIRALKGADRRYVAAVRLAAKEAGMGDVNVVLYRLSRTDKERNDDPDLDQYDIPFEPEKNIRGSVQLGTQYNEDGTLRTSTLDFIDWSAALSNLDFELMDAGEVHYTGNEGATRQATYGALAVAIWPRV